MLTLILSGMAAMICSASVSTRDSSSEGNAKSSDASGWPKKQSVNPYSIIHTSVNLFVCEVIQIGFNLKIRISYLSIQSLRNFEQEDDEIESSCWGWNHFDWDRGFQMSHVLNSDSKSSPVQMQTLWSPGRLQSGWNYVLPCFSSGERQGSTEQELSQIPNDRSEQTTSTSNTINQSSLFDIGFALSILQ